jgi:hypothetical protein
MSETSEITGPLIKNLNQTGGYAIRMQVGMAKIGKHYIHMHEEGTADILFFPRLTCNQRARTPVWIETKHPKGTTHKERAIKQAEFRARVEALGHRYILATTVDEGLEALR